ncbi:MAG: hypothetical protein IKQ50_05740 [Paludibacteraceae bacterium]|nr:hypothetical protein [Paludibacteraceae bacterium]
MKKDSTDRALRLTKRNALISTIFYELINNEGFGFMQAYVFLEEIFGIDERQIRKIIRQNAKVELSSDNLAKLAVLLQRISNWPQKCDRNVRGKAGWHPAQQT